MTQLWGDGAPTPVGIGAKALPSTASRSGTMRCTCNDRARTGGLTQDDAGRVTGSVPLGDPGLDTPLATLEVDGAHNLTTGMITVAPLPWVEPDPSTQNFGVTRAWDPAPGAWGGDVWTDVAACPPGTWSVEVHR
jgi:hypothetical protein